MKATGGLMMNYVTLYDSSYLSRGVAMYRSLCRCSLKTFHMYVLALDAVTSKYWKDQRKEDITVFDIKDMEQYYPVLEHLARERSHAEFCWTCSAFSVQYVIRRYKVSSCIYLDADIYFYSNPERLIVPLVNESVLITEHNYTPNQDMSRQSGKFCVQFMFFKNNADGREVLEWWRARCEEECTHDEERGLCGDQKYLDDWESRFEGKVYACRDIGCGVAPWNLQRYELRIIDNEFYVKDNLTKMEKPVVFFHFHGLKQLNKMVWKMCPYYVGKNYMQLIYTPYIKELLMIQEDDGVPESETLKIEQMRRLRIWPIPYLGLTCIESVNRPRKGEISIKMKGNEGIVKIWYKLVKYEGKWIRIEKVDGALLLAKYFEEIIWCLQRQLMFGNIDDEKTIYSICERIRRKERILTEMNENLLEEQNYSHPMIDNKEIVRLYEKGNDLGYFDFPKEQILFLESDEAYV